MLHWYLGRGKAELLLPLLLPAEDSMTSRDPFESWCWLVYGNHWDMPVFELFDYKDAYTFCSVTCSVKAHLLLSQLLLLV